MIPPWIVLAALSVSLAGFLAVALAPHLRRARRLWFVIAAIVAASFANSTGGVSYVFWNEMGIYDNGSYFDAETKTLEARWTYAPYVEGYKLRWFWYYKQGDDQNPHSLPEVDVSACAASYRLPDEVFEKNSAIIVVLYTEYVAPPVVVTNGVYHLSGVSRDMSGGDKFVTPKVEIVVNIENGETEILTPTNQLPKVKGISE
jgi:hypothetical protein